MGPRPMAGGGGGVEIVSFGTSTSAGPVPGPPPLTASLAQKLAAGDQRGTPVRGHPQDNIGNTVGQGVGAGVGLGSGNESGSNSILTEIRKRIERAKQYPSFARQQGVEGVAEVRFLINPDGSLGVNQVVRSSGSALLDEAALATIHRAGPYPVYWGPLQVKIKFSLRD